MNASVLGNSVIDLFCFYFQNWKLYVWWFPILSYAATDTMLVFRADIVPPLCVNSLEACLNTQRSRNSIGYTCLFVVQPSPPGVFLALDSAATAYELILAGLSVYTVASRGERVSLSVHVIGVAPDGIGLISFRR